MAAENCVMCLVGAMDRLWFHQIILFSEPNLFNPKSNIPNSESIQNLSQNNSEQEISVIKSKNNETSNQESDQEERKPRSNVVVVVSSKSRFYMSSPMSNKNHSARKLQKTTSCKSLGELEIEEVKGFMDLGFIFKKDNLSKHLTSLIPGLQRIDAYNFQEFTSSNHEDFEDDYEEEEEEEEEENDEEKQGIIRPYLSEAWIVKRPDSPLLNLKVPRVSTTADMKKHLKFWARSVATAIQHAS